MQLGILSQCHLAFDPLKPIILRGLPTEDESTLFAGNVVLTLPRPTKILNVSVTLKSEIMTYWPEGIGIRGTKLTAEKSLGEQTLEILASNKNDTNTPVLMLPAGTHRFSFAFVVPNSTVASIEDTFGRVRHIVEAEVQRPGMVMLSSLKISKPIMILRTYMSNSLLTNNSLTNLSKTFEKHMNYGDIELVIEAAAFSSGDLFYIRMIIEPQLKHTRLEHMEIKVVEQRKYSVPEMKAWRHETYTYAMPFAGSMRLAEFGESDVTTEQLMPIFDKSKNGIELIHDFAHRLAFQSPTCQQKIRHTTYIKEIQFNHHIEISFTMSYEDQQGNRQFVTINNDTAMPSTSEPTPMILTPPPAAYVVDNNRLMNRSNIPLSTPPSPSLTSQRNSSYADVVRENNGQEEQEVVMQDNDGNWSNVILRLNKFKIEKSKDKHNDNRRKETIILDTPITVYDCRLKEDYGKLPSYFELGVKPKPKATKKKSNTKYSPVTSSRMMDKPNQPHPYLCSCYHTFCREMELASEALYLSTETAPAMPLLDRIPSIPPPDYAA